MIRQSSWLVKILENMQPPVSRFDRAVQAFCLGRSNHPGQLVTRNRASPSKDSGSWKTNKKIREEKGTRRGRTGGGRRP